MKLHYLFILVALVLVACTGTDPVAPTFGSVKGTVRDPAGQKLLSMVQIITIPGSSSVLTDTAGFYAIHDIVPGDYTLKALYVDTSYTATASVPIKVIPGSTTTADIILSYGREQSNVIQGLVVDAQGNGVSGATISTAPASMQTVSDKDGRFILFDLESSVYRVQAKNNQLTASALVDLQKTNLANVKLVLLSIAADGMGYATLNGTTSINVQPKSSLNGPVENTANFRIGSLESSESRGGLTGKVDHVLIYSREMPLTELRTNMEQDD